MPHHCFNLSAYLLPTPHNSLTSVSCNASIIFSSFSSTITHLVALLFFYTSLLANLDKTLVGATPTDTFIPVHCSVVSLIVSARRYSCSVGTSSRSRNASST